MANISFQQKTKTIIKLAENGITSEKDLQNLTIDSILSIPKATHGKEKFKQNLVTFSCMHHSGL